jgi:hypothetical protein
VKKREGRRREGARERSREREWDKWQAMDETDEGEERARRDDLRTLEKGGRGKKRKQRE